MENDALTFSDTSFIVVVESDPDRMYEISSLLKDDGFRVIGAMDGAAAMESIDREIPDLMIIDLNMADETAYELVRRLRDEKKDKTAKIVAIISDDGDTRLIEGGADAILRKPIDVKGLHSTVKKLLKGEG